MARKFKVSINWSPKFTQSSEVVRGHVNIGDDIWSASLLPEVGAVEFASDLAPMDAMFPGRKIKFTSNSKLVATLEVVSQH